MSPKERRATFYGEERDSPVPLADFEIRIQQLAVLFPLLSRLSRPDVVEADQVDVLSPAVFCYFQQIQHSQESRLAGQLRSNVRKSDPLDRIDFNRAFLHRVTRSGADMRACPDADAACNFPASDARAEPLSECHEWQTSWRANSIFERRIRAGEPLGNGRRAGREKRQGVWVNAANRGSDRSVERR